MTDIWNERYAQNDYVYGKLPNEFFKEQLSRLQPGKILLPAEGEGRNAVFAALKGWKVFAFDSSTEARKKAQKLALENKIEINYIIGSFEDVHYKPNSFDLIALIYAHTENRQSNHQRLLQFLKPGGIILLEGFSKSQINKNTGGPKKAEMLFSKEELQSDFSSVSELNISETELFLSEGQHHSGYASVIRLIGKK